MQINSGVREELMHVAAARINTCVVSPSGSRAPQKRGQLHISGFEFCTSRDDCYLNVFNVIKCLLKNKIKQYIQYVYIYIFIYIVFGSLGGQVTNEMKTPTTSIERPKAEKLRIKWDKIQLTVNK